MPQERRKAKKRASPESITTAISGTKKRQKPTKKLKSGGSSSDVDAFQKRKKPRTKATEEYEQEIKQLDTSSLLRAQYFPEHKPTAASFSAMSSLLKECLLGQRWEEANQLLTAMCLYQVQETDYQWKCGLHVMQNHPNGSHELVEQLFSVVSKVKLVSQNKLKLEHALYLLSQDRIQEAHSALDSKTLSNYGVPLGHAADSERWWKELTAAYTGLVEYYLWRKSALHPEEDDHDSGSPGATSNDGSRALLNLGKISQNPGVWDIFVTKQIEILESQGKISEAKRVLTKYRDDNPTNPNAHVYLYQFSRLHKRHKPKKLCKILKKLIEVLPADTYTLEYVALLEETNSATAEKVLPVLFNMADYSSCHCSTSLWKLLVKHVLHVVQRPGRPGKRILRDCWDCRKAWWDSYHFSRKQVTALVAHHFKAAAQKAILAAVFYGSSHPFVQKVQTRLEEAHPKTAHKLRRELLPLCKPLG